MSSWGHDILSPSRLYRSCQKQSTSILQLKATNICSNSLFNHIIHRHAPHCFCSGQNVLPIQLLEDPSQRRFTGCACIVLALTFKSGSQYCVACASDESGLGCWQCRASKRWVPTRRHLANQNRHQQLPSHHTQVVSVKLIGVLSVFVTLRC